MFAGKLAAGAGAVEGWAGEIHLNLIGLRTAALALAPERAALRIQTQNSPFLRRRKAAPGARGCGVGRQSGN